MTALLPSPGLPDAFTHIFDSVLVVALIGCFVTQFILVRMIRSMREELTSQRLAMNALGGKDNLPKKEPSRVVPRVVGRDRPCEVTRVDRKKTALAALAKTILLAKPSPKPKVVEKLYVAKAGNNLGEIDVFTIRAMLKSGELSARDHFYEINKQIWSSLDRHPAFCV